MFFEEQVRIFVQLIIFQAYFQFLYLPKKELACMMIHVRKIFNCLSNAIANALVINEKKLWIYRSDQITFRMALLT